LVTYTTAPSAPGYLLQALVPSRGWHVDEGLPELHATWTGFRIETKALAEIQEVAGAEHRLPADKMALLAPHVVGFRLLMAMLTHRSWPLPIWKALQVRNRLTLHRPLRDGEVLPLTARMAAWRVLDKGLEVDLHTSLGPGGASAWESVVTFYYRGRFGQPAEHGGAPGAPLLAPRIGERFTASDPWPVGGRDRWHFAALTGDYNGLHLWNWYARRFGFLAAFAHPQRVTAQCLANLPAQDAGRQQLDLWIRGPAYYGAKAVLRSAPATEGACNFALDVAGDARPAFLGTWTNSHR
jgi:hypothetical protein